MITNDDGDEEDPVFKATLPGFLNFSHERNLPGCLYKFDKPNEQCSEGRTGEKLWQIFYQMIPFHFLGILCAECRKNYSLTMDLLNCKNDCSDWGASILFIAVCK